MKEQENKKQPFSEDTAEIELEIDKEFEKLYGLAYSHDEPKENSDNKTEEEASAEPVPQLEEDVKIFDSSEVLFESEDDESDEYSIENISFDTEEEVKKNSKKGNQSESDSPFYIIGIKIINLLYNIPTSK